MTRQLRAHGDPKDGAATATPSGAGGGGRTINVCYAAGTRILTDAGEVAIERLRPGDKVYTVSGCVLIPRSVKWLGWRRINLSALARREAAAPILIQRGALADNVPHRDLHVSPAHGILIDDQLICAGHLVNGATIRRERDWNSVTYYHLELDAHAIIVAEGLLAESYLDTGNRSFFSNSGDVITLFPNPADGMVGALREAGSCRALITRTDAIRPVWQRLAARAAALGYARPPGRVTSDAAPLVAVNGCMLPPTARSGDVLRFDLPPGARHLRLLSRATVPRELHPGHGDQRRLGLAVRSIRFGVEDRMVDTELEAAEGWAGWWDVERNGPARWRWTDGNASLTVPLRATMLEVAAGSLPAYLVTDDVAAVSGDEAAL